VLQLVEAVHDDAVHGHVELPYLFHLPPHMVVDGAKCGGSCAREILQSNAGRAGMSTSSSADETASCGLCL
jgi:hypothetical protein